MQHNKVYSGILRLFFIGVTLASCKEQKTTENSSVGQEQENTLAVKSEEAVDISDYFPGANFMKVIAIENDSLNLSEEQQQKFANWRGEYHHVIEGKMHQIAQLEAEIKSLSQERVEAEKIMEKFRETAILRNEIAITKLMCRDLIRETLKPGQWTLLKSDYEKAHPFTEPTKMMEVMQHVNPVPNYMQLINASLSELEISSDQERKFENWSTENHPKMMGWAKRVITLEKEIYQISLQQASKENIFEKFEDINSLRTKIVETKTNCRDMVIKTLSEDQWQDLIEMTD